MKHYTIYFLFSFILFSFSACNNEQAKDDKTKTLKSSVSDAEIDNNEKLEKIEGKNYKKIVVVGDAIAEIMMNLVDTSKIVGIHKTLPFAPNFKADKVGYENVLKSDFILKTKTEVVFSDEEGCPDSEAKKLKKKKVDYFQFNKPNNIGDTKAIIQEISQRVKQESKGKTIISQIDDDIKSIRDLVKERKDSLKVLYVYSRGPVVTLTAGKGTAIDEFIRLAGAKNAAEDYEGMEKLTAEEIVALNPNLILMSEESKASLEGKTHEASVLMSSPLYRMNVVFLLKEHDMTSFSVNTANAAYKLANKLYGKGY